MTDKDKSLVGGIDMTIVDGQEIEVVAREKATSDSNLPDATGHLMKTVDRILLADERVMFQCVHHAQPDCGYVAGSVASVTAHQRVHGGKAVGKRAEAEIAAVKAEAERLANELAERKRRQVEGGRRAAETRMRRMAEKETTTTTTMTTTVPQSSTDAHVAEIQKAMTRVVFTQNAVDEAMEQHRETVLHLLKLVKENPGCDPQVIAKAKQYDVLRSALGDIK